MFKWISRIVVLALIGFVGVSAYQYYRLGIYSMPDLPEGAYYVAFKNGLRGVVLDADVPPTSTGNDPKFFRSLHVENRDRKYLGVPVDVPAWFKESWSFCDAPTDAERQSIPPDLPAKLQQSLRNARFEAVCHIDVDGEPMLRGLLFSVPRV